MTGTNAHTDVSSTTIPPPVYVGYVAQDTRVPVELDSRLMTSTPLVMRLQDSTS